VHFSEYDTRLAAYAVIVDEQDRLLLSWFVGNENAPACWTMPGAAWSSTSPWRGPWMPLDEVPSLTPRADIIDVAFTAWKNHPAADPGR